MLDGIDQQYLQKLKKATLNIEEKNNGNTRTEIN